MEQPDQALIEAAREAIAAGEVTAAGLPTVESLEKRLGRNVTARERDEAVNSLESGVRSPEEKESNPESSDPTSGEGNEMVQETKQAEPLVYIGPTLTGKVQVTRHGIFRTLPPALKEAVEADPDLNRLFVPVSDLARARGELTRPTRLARAFKAVAGKYRKVAK